MSEHEKGTSSLPWKPETDDEAGELEAVVNPLDLMEETEDYPAVDELLDEELDGSFPASDAPSSTPTTSLGGPEHAEDRSA